ncbi:MAG TPA: asparaginase [Thiomicrospira sp.]|jgi:L-asparaginase|nr:asparaginase [Thiomicrospira sp.]
MNETIELLVTGGTLDKDYNVLTGELVFTQTHLPEMLAQANCQLPIKQTVLMLKDSLELTNNDRQTILTACEKSNCHYIVITHGTDTMVDTAKFLNTSKEIVNKVIIITGAMRPFKLGNSDALFNLGCALSMAKIARCGVYIAMNGVLFDADNVKKDTAKGLFTALGFKPKT